MQECTDEIYHHISFREFCDGIEQTIEASRLNKAIAKDKRTPSLCLKKEGGIFLRRMRETGYICFVRTHSPLFPGSYTTEEDNNILPDLPKIDRRGKKGGTN